MLAAISFDAFGGEFIYLLIGLAKNGGWHLQEIFFFRTGNQETGVRYEFGCNRIETAVVFQDFLNKSRGTSHI